MVSVLLCVGVLGIRCFRLWLLEGNFNREFSFGYSSFEIVFLFIDGFKSFFVFTFFFLVVLGFRFGRGVKGEVVG